MSSDYLEMTYHQLKTECIKHGLDKKGTREELLARLGVTDSNPLKDQQLKELEDKVPNPPTPELDLKAPVQNELIKYLPNAPHVQMKDPAIFAAWIDEDRLQQLANKIEPIAAGKGKFEFQIDKANSAFQVQFSGRPLGLYGTTLIDTDLQIIKQAQWYFNARVRTGRNNQSSRL